MLSDSNNGRSRNMMSSFVLMTILWILSTSIGWSDSFMLTDSNCMAPLPCHCGRNQIACAGQHFTSIPSFEPTDTHVKDLTITLPVNNLTIIPANAFMNINTTRASTITILFQTNKLHQIDMDAFVGIENAVTVLHFEDNKFTGVPAALTRLTNLQKVRLEANPITTIDPVVMSQMSLTFVEFAVPAENLTSWPYGLNYLRHLDYLLLYGIPFHHLPLDAFHGFGSSLTELAISGSFSGVPSAVCFLRNLKVLSVNSHTYQTPSQMLSLHEKCQLLISTIDSFVQV